jgi:formaldehyde-activating enzyme involved in methanogenesis
MRYIGGDREYRDFYEAKQAALELAMAQEPNADAVL